MRIITILTVFIISISIAYSQEIEPRSINLTSFKLSEIPDSLTGCSCLFSASIEKYNSDDFLYFDDIGNNCIISIDNEVLLLKSKDDKYYNETYTVYIQNKKEIGKGYESTEYNAELVIIDKKGNKTVTKIYGICGC